MALQKVKKLTTFPSGTTASDLKFDALIEQMIGDDVYVGEGTLDATDLATLVASQASIATEPPPPSMSRRPRSPARSTQADHSNLALVAATPTP